VILHVQLRTQRPGPNSAGQLQKIVVHLLVVVNMAHGVHGQFVIDNVVVVSSHVLDRLLTGSALSNKRLRSEFVILSLVYSMRVLVLLPLCLPPLEPLLKQRWSVVSQDQEPWPLLPTVTTSTSLVLCQLATNLQARPPPSTTM